MIQDHQKFTSDVPRKIDTTPESQLMWEIIIQTFTDFQEDKCTRIAAALSYYTIFSLAPLLTLAMAIGGLVLEPEDVQGKIEQEVQALVGEEGAKQVRTMIKAAEGGPLGGGVESSGKSTGIVATIISSGVLLVGLIGMIGQMQSAMNDVWEVKPDPDQSFWRRMILSRLLSFGMLAAAGFLLMVSLLMSTAITFVGDSISNLMPGSASETILQVVNFALSFVIVTAIFAAIFKYLPDVEVSWHDVAVGSAVTALLFVIGKSLIGLYLGSKNMESTYGAAGSLALLLTWIYYSSIIFLLGAEFTQAWAKIRGDGIKPSKFAVKVN